MQARYVYTKGRKKDNKILPIHIDTIASIIGTHN